jgi:hypothetical protein
MALEQGCRWVFFCSRASTQFVFKFNVSLHDSHVAPHSNPPYINFYIFALVQPSKLHHNTFVTEQSQHNIQPTISTPVLCSTLQHTSLHFTSPSSLHNALPCFLSNFFTSRTIGHNLWIFRAVKCVLPRNNKFGASYNSRLFVCYYYSSLRSC